MTAVEGWTEGSHEWVSGVGWRGMFAQRADLFLDIVFSSHEASSGPEGLLLHWFGDGD